LATQTHFHNTSTVVAKLIACWAS